MGLARREHLEVGNIDQAGGRNFERCQNFVDCGAAELRVVAVGEHGLDFSEVS